MCLEKPHEGECNSEIVSSISSIYKNKTIKFCHNPKCRTAISKNGGCLHVVCTKCGTQFHWRTMEIMQLSNFDYYQEYLHPGEQDDDSDSDYDSVTNDTNYDSDPDIDYYNVDYFNGKYDDDDNRMGHVVCIECGLDICVLNYEKCCWCADDRAEKSYVTYIEDVGLVELNNYWEDYCASCREIAEIKIDGHKLMN
jgi:hypothetical protein